MINRIKKILSKEKVSNSDILFIFVLNIIFKIIYIFIKVIFVGNKSNSESGEDENILFTLLSILCYAPIMEEIAFRGVLRNRNELVYPVLLLISPIVIFSVDIYFGIIALLLNIYVSREFFYKEKEKVSNVVAIVYALIFAFCHHKNLGYDRFSLLSILEYLPFIVTGLCLTFIRMKGTKLYKCILYHSLVNFILLLPWYFWVYKK